MQQACAALPVLDGKVDALRAFMKELEGPRKAQFAASENKIGIPKESWYLQETPAGALLLVYLESADAAKAFTMFAESKDEFDVWFKKNMLEVTGIDFNVPPPGPLSEQLSNYEA